MTTINYGVISPENKQLTLQEALEDISIKVDPFSRPDLNWIATTTDR
jgi:hypothetical protein